MAGTLVDTVTSISDAVEVPQVFVAVTFTFPDVVPTVPDTDIVPCPEEIIHPEGAVQVYDVAPATADMLYAKEVAAHSVAVPVIVPGVAGAPIPLTVVVRGDEHPDALQAVTDTFPLVAPGRTVIVFVFAPLRTVHPLGKVQL